MQTYSVNQNKMFLFTYYCATRHALVTILRMCITSANSLVMQNLTVEPELQLIGMPYGLEFDKTANVPIRWPFP